MPELIRRCLIVPVLALLLTGCAGQGLRLAALEADPVPPRTLLAGVPFYPQQAYQCGPAALAMVLNARGREATPEALKAQVYLPARQGSLQVEMVAAARQHDLLAYPLEQDLTAIVREVAAGNPVLVLQNLRFNWWPQWHYAVVIGYDLPRRELILHSGTRARLRTDFRTFDNTWARGDRWARVFMEPDRLPATAEPLPFVRAAYELEQTGRAAAARQAYRTATEAWPDNTAARFARANAALGDGHYKAAQIQFNLLVASHPDFAPGWNNLALALGHNGCAQAAHQALDCALTLAPEDERFLQTRSQLPDSPDAAPQAPQCPQAPHYNMPACPAAGFDTLDSLNNGNARANVRNTR